jgi:hypothetical protein
MTIPRLLVHIGVPKTATTSLQFGFFPNHPDIRYLGKPFYDESFGYEGSVESAKLMDSLWKEDSLQYDPDLAKARFSAGVAPRLSTDRIAVVSEEGLSQASAADRAVTARRLRALTHDLDCRILITIREQKKALYSGYQWIFARRMTSRSFANWLDWCQSYSSYYGCLNDFPLRQYLYAPLVEVYRQAFGADNVLVLPMELLNEPDNRFVREIEAFCGISAMDRDGAGPLMPAENRSPGQLGIRYQRLAKGIFMLKNYISGHRADSVSEAMLDGGLHGRVMRQIARIDRPMPPMSAALSQRLADYYRDDNRRLLEQTGLPLQRLGYDCGMSDSVGPSAGR